MIKSHHQTYSLRGFQASSSVVGLVIRADLELKLLNALLHANDVLLKSGLVVLQLGQLLLESSALGLLVGIVALNLFFNAMELVGKGLAGVSLLHGEHALKGFLL